MTYAEQKISDKIKQLYDAGYTCDYPPLAELLDEWEEIEAREERQAQLSEVMND